MRIVSLAPLVQRLVPEVGLDLYFSTELVLYLSLLQLALEQDLPQHTHCYNTQTETGSELTLSATTNLLFFSRARYTLPNFPEGAQSQVLHTQRQRRSSSQSPLPSGRPMSKSSRLHRFFLKELREK